MDRFKQRRHRRLKSPVNESVFEDDFDIESFLKSEDIVPMVCILSNNK